MAHYVAGLKVRIIRLLSMGDVSTNLVGEVVDGVTDLQATIGRLCCISALVGLCDFGFRCAYVNLDNSGSLLL